METLQLIAVIVGGTLVFFTVIGVFGLPFAATGLVIASTASILIFWRSTFNEEQP